MGELRPVILSHLGLPHRVVVGIKGEEEIDKHHLELVEGKKLGYKYK